MQESTKTLYNYEIKVNIVTAKELSNDFLNTTITNLEDMVVITFNRANNIPNMVVATFDHKQNIKDTYENIRDKYKKLVFNSYFDDVFGDKKGE